MEIWTLLLVVTGGGVIWWRIRQDVARQIRLSTARDRVELETLRGTVDELASQLEQRATSAQQRVSTAEEQAALVEARVTEAIRAVEGIEGRISMLSANGTGTRVNGVRPADEERVSPSKAPSSDARTSEEPLGETQSTRSASKATSVFEPVEVAATRGGANAPRKSMNGALAATPPNDGGNVPLSSPDVTDTAPSPPNGVDALPLLTNGALAASNAYRDSRPAMSRQTENPPEPIDIALGTDPIHHAPLDLLSVKPGTPIKTTRHSPNGARDAFAITRAAPADAAGDTYREVPVAAGDMNGDTRAEAVDVVARALLVGSEATRGGRVSVTGKTDTPSSSTARAGHLASTDAPRDTSHIEPDDVLSGRIVLAESITPARDEFAIPVTRSEDERGSLSSREGNGSDDFVPFDHPVQRLTTRRRKPIWAASQQVETLAMASGQADRELPTQPADTEPIAPPVEVSLSEGNGSRTITNGSQPPVATGRHGVVLDLLVSGVSDSGEIARVTGLSRGEVELILDMNSRQSQ